MIERLLYVPPKASDEYVASLLAMGYRLEIGVDVPAPAPEVPPPAPPPEAPKKARRAKKWSQRRLKAWRSEVLCRDAVCKGCGAAERLHAHHKIPKSVAPDLAYDVENGVALCASCHAEEHRHDFPTLAAWMAL